MIFGYATGLSVRGLILLLAVAGLLIWSGRGDAASLAGGHPEAALAAAPLDHLAPARADLTIRGELGELTLRGGDPQAVSARLTGGETALLIVRIGDEEILVAELQSLILEDPRLAALATRLLDREQIGIRGRHAPAVAAAMRTSGSLQPAQAANDPPGSASEPLPGVVRAQRAFALVPEPTTGALLASGLLVLVIGARRVRPARGFPPRADDAAPRSGTRAATTTSEASP